MNKVDKLLKSILEEEISAEMRTWLMELSLLINEERELRQPPAAVIIWQEMTIVQPNNKQVVLLRSPDNNNVWISVYYTLFEKTYKELMLQWIPIPETAQ